MKTTGTNIVILANVDAGKTTLIESILFQTGVIRKLGRVDHRDAFLDQHELERKRGITIFSKMVQIRLGGRDVTLLDTPGHVDFSAETERTVRAADCAALLISASDLVTGHTLTLWSILQRYHLPVFLFVNKMDLPGAKEQTVMSALERDLDEHCVRWRGERDEAFCEAAAMGDEQALNLYLESGTLPNEEIIRLWEGRLLFPCFFGSALKLEGIAGFLEGISFFLRDREKPDIFGAHVFKIAYDEKGTRLTFLKMEGGYLKARTLIRGNSEYPGDENGQDAENTQENIEEKVNQIRIYSGEKYVQAEELKAGQTGAVTGLSHSFCGQTYGVCAAKADNLVEPVLSYSLIWPEETDKLEMFGMLKELAQEIPEISPQLDPESEAIHVRVMGEVQTGILQSLIRERYGIEISFGDARVVYRETIQTTAEGVGHFEPLRHYAEVHLLLEPGERGSGMVYSSACSGDVLSANWQKLVLSSLKARRQTGVLTGSELTDVKVTLVSGKSHVRHTCGGDFPQAARRALRQGLMKCESVLLEPWYRFELDLPSGQIGRALQDIESLCGSVGVSQIRGDRAYLTGRAPVSAMRNYQAQVRAYTGGRGWLELAPDGYDLCHNAQEVIDHTAYDPESDLHSPSWSVFCAQGRGVEVPWNEVDERAHVPLQLAKHSGALTQDELIREAYGRYKSHEATAAELDEIFERTYGPVRRNAGEGKRDLLSYYSDLADAQADGKNHASGGGRSGPVGLHRPRPCDSREKYLLVDGYNVIFDWPSLRSLADRQLDSARTKLADILSNYQGYRKMNLILVFDAYRVPSGVERMYKYHNIYVVYTREAETADHYIEAAVHKMASGSDIMVATSDQVEQVIILGAGARRMSSRELREEIERTGKEIRENYLSKGESGKNMLFDSLPQEMAALMEEVRLGKRGLQ